MYSTVNHPDLSVSNCMGMSIGWQGEHSGSVGSALDWGSELLN